MKKKKKIHELMKKTKVEKSKQSHDLEFKLLLQKRRNRRSACNL
jgi:hypothetical protein